MNEPKKSDNELFQPCSERQRIVQFKADGTKKAIQKCGAVESKMVGLPVLPDDCEACPVRKMVTEAALKAKEYSPPLVAEFTTVASTRPDDGSDPRFLPCLDRNIAEIGSCCGGSLPIRVCDSVDCWRLGSEVNSGMCGACPYRRPE